MKKIIRFFIGIITVALTCGALFIVGVIYDTGNKISVETYFFQPNNLSSRRIGIPVTPAELGDGRVIDMLVDKFISEYFYVIPDTDNVAIRTSSKGTLFEISNRNVFAQWQEEISPQIMEMAEKRMFRTANVVGNVIKPTDESEYWTVNYQLRTWTTPNDFSTQPEITQGKMYIKLIYERGIRDSIMLRGIHHFLEKGGNPVVLFKFRVTEVIQE